ncbi:BnaA08g02370D [Brassica napus]|uniref:BnaA08g02370D protein n=1 Tax=Brassica napus TaxID=3708 RepID=A0A078FQ21_BRANA|nr:BnaA08g02370D [Brassica napus]
MEMEKKQGFFSALRDEVIRSFTPSRSRPRSRSASPRTAAGGYHLASQPEPLIGRSESLRPVIEGPDPDNDETQTDSKRIGSGLGHWVKGQMSRAPSVASTRSDLRLLLGVLGAPLAPIKLSSSVRDSHIETSTAQYILQQYTAASGGQKLQSSVKNAYANGKVKMITSELETPTRTVRNRNPTKPETGGFVLWQMNPDMWYVELSVGSSKVRAGCNGKLVWRHTPWLGSHTANGPVRPLRRALQGLDPRTTAAIFAESKCVGEKKVNGEDCFILKLCTDPGTLKARSEGPAEIVRHILFGYFSQRTGLLVQFEDSQLTRIQSNSGDAVYWETTINSSLEDYRQVEGIMIAHSGRSVVTLFRFGEVAMSHTRTKMEERWTIEEVAFNVPGLSPDCFIPPADLRSSSLLTEACEYSDREEKGKSSIMLAAHRAKVAALEKGNLGNDHPVWQIDV